MKPKLFSTLYVLSPLIVFFIIFIGSGIYFTFQGQAYAFYQVSASVAILPAILIAFALFKKPIAETLSVFLKGAGDNNIIVMCLVYLLAGAFTSVLQNIGSIDATVHLALKFMPANATLPMLFLLSAFVSTAMGTSMGTISAVGPIGVGIAHAIGLSLPLTMGTIVGGAMFGDNLSVISDTSIAATQIHGCTAKEKFRNNIRIALPAMALTILLLLTINQTTLGNIPIDAGNYPILKCLPYFLVLGSIFISNNVFIVLTLGIISAGIVGLLAMPSYTLVEFSKNIFEGYKNMTEILILSLLMGGLGELIKQRGGFSLLNESLKAIIDPKNTTNQKTAEGAMSAIASLTDLCTANNTVAIILSGETTKEIATRYSISPGRAAMLVDLFSCTIQGIIPYGAQLLMAGALAGLSPVSIMPHVYYCFLLGIMGIGFIIIQPSRKNQASLETV